MATQLLADITNLRETICTSSGYPYELLYGGAQKSEILKKYARYLKRVKSIQSSIAKGLIQVALTHLNNLEGMTYVSPTQVVVTFKNENINIDELEKIEYQDAILSMIKNISTHFLDMAESPLIGKYVDTTALMQWQRDKLFSMSDSKYHFIKSEGEVNKKPEQEAPKPEEERPGICRSFGGKD